MPAAELPQTPSTVPQPLASAVLDLRDRMYNAGTYTEAAATLEEVLDPRNGLLPRLEEVFEAAAEQVNSFQDPAGWDLADQFTAAAAQLGDLGDELADATDELRDLARPTPSWQPDAAVRRSTTVLRDLPGPQPAAPADSFPAAQPEGPARRAR